MVFELQFLDWLQTLQTTILNEIMKAVTHLGDAGALWIILAAVLLAFPKTRKSGAIVAAALIVDLVLCNGILKNIFARTRRFVVKEGISLLSRRRKIFLFLRDIRRHRLQRLRRCILQERRNFGK